MQQLTWSQSHWTSADHFFLFLAVPRVIHQLLNTIVCKLCTLRIAVHAGLRETGTLLHVSMYVLLHEC